MQSELKLSGLAVASALLLTASFPKIELAILAWVALVPLLWALKDAAPAGAFRRGLIFGIAHYLSLLYWLVPTMVIYGHLPAYIGVAVLFLFAFILSLLFIAPFACGLSLVGRTPVRMFLFFPVLWVGSEFLRSFLFTGFPWELLGYSQYRQLHLIQISDIVGVYGVSGLIALVNAAIFLGSLAVSGNSWHGKPVKQYLGFGSGTAAVVLMSLTWIYGGLRIEQIDRLSTEAPKARIAVIQGNIEQSQKWDPAFQRATLEKYIRLSLSTRPRDPDLIVWPESAAPFYFLAEVPPTQFLTQGIIEAGKHFLIGAPHFETRGQDAHYFNSAYLVGPEGELLGRYDKAHLVPYGEYTPFKQYLPFLGKMVEHVGDFVSGAKGKILKMPGLRLGVQICYEIIFPELSRAMVQNGATLLITITNDAWYGTTAGPYQHFSLAVMRAVETRRSLARAANTGISGFVDPAGRILDPTPLMVETGVVRELPLLDARTVYTHIEDVFAAACLGLSLFAAGWAGICFWRNRGEPASEKW